MRFTICPLQVNRTVHTIISMIHPYNLLVGSRIPGLRPLNYHYFNGPYSSHYLTQIESVPMLINFYCCDKKKRNFLKEELYLTDGSRGLMFIMVGEELALGKQTK